MVKVLSRDAVQRMTGRRSSSAVNIGGGSGDASGVSRAWVEENYISKAFFETLFTIHGTKEEDGVTTDVVITPNDTETTLKNIQAMVGLWTNSYLSALGLNPGGGGGGGTGSVTSVDMSVPTGFTISGSPITTSGTLAISFASGYSLPTTAKQTQWDAAYSWGNHALAGYAKVSETMVLINHGMSTIDADTIKTAGSHRLSNSGTNFPAGPDWGQMLVVHGGGDTYAQMYFPYSESAIYFRNGNPDSRTGSWREWKRILTAGDAVTSVAMSVPTGFSISGSPITTSGTLALSFAAGYSLPTTAKQTQWDAKQDAISDLATIRSNASHGETAYNWGNHATAGYATKTWVQQGYLPLTGGTMQNTALVTNLNADMLDGRHGDGYAVIGAYGTTIAPNTDLNDILHAGTYTCGSGSEARTLSNTPYTDGNFRLWHIVNTGTDGNTSGQWSSQIVLAPNEARMFIRSHENSSFGTWKEFAYLTSNVASATKLHTPRTIWGQSFDGTGNVSGDITDAGNIFAKGDYLLLSSGKSKYGLMVESTSWGENRDCAFGFHAATSGHDIAWSTRSGQNDICLDLVIDPNNTVAKRYTRVYDALCIGDGMIIWDSANNALKVIKMNGDAANFYATGGVSALGIS